MNRFFSLEIIQVNIQNIRTFRQRGALQVVFQEFRFQSAAVIMFQCLVVFAGRRIVNDRDPGIDIP